MGDYGKAPRERRMRKQRGQMPLAPIDVAKTPCSVCGESLTKYNVYKIFGEVFCTQCLREKA